MLRKKNEKKSQVKGEAYYAMKMNEARENLKDLALVALEDSMGTYQVFFWKDASDEDEDEDGEGCKGMLKNMDKASDDDDFCLMARDARPTILEQVSKLPSSFKILVSQYSSNIAEIARNCSVMNKNAN
ncbi:hypothetical protein L2E82_24459 [Cichorium intybus]|uniref:Uncharacterized protein n=1 Tax=Cichorium intybus TaxID=13427 RepID=A0ACB9E1U5_CICIN|nr:hypothetical protein L2E82_24459 [Cichorium intybus]